jgi:hypothetical protein
MSKTLKIFLMLSLVAMVMGGFAHVTRAQIVFTAQDDDIYNGYNGNYNSASFYVDGVYRGKLDTGSYSQGGGGGLGSPRIVINNAGGGNCVFISDSGGISGGGPGDIGVFDVPDFIANYTSNYGGNGYNDGIALASAKTVLVAGWTASNTLETFNIGAGCTLSKGTAITLTGGGGAIDGLAMALSGKFVVVTFGDGAYAVVKLDGATLGAENGPYVSNCYKTQGLIPTGVAVNPTGSYAYMDCVGTAPATIDAFKVSTPNVTVTNTLSAKGGTAIVGSVALGLSSDGKLMDILGWYSGAVETALVDGTTITDAGCPSGNVSLPGYGSTWLTPGTINVLGTSASGGGGAVVAEAGWGQSKKSYVQELFNTPNFCLSIGPLGTDPNSEFGVSATSVIP